MSSIKTWLDPKTSLEWESGRGSEMTWAGALEYARTLGEGWRLPTLAELETLLHRGKCSPACSKPISCFSSRYWSSTTYAPNNTNAWNVGFYNGCLYYSHRTRSCYVRCVRNNKKKLDWIGI